MSPAASKRVSAAAALGVFALALLASGAVAAPGPWQLPTRLGDTGRAAIAPKVELAVGAAGEAVAVWERRDRGISAIEAASRPAAGGWSAPLAISGKGQEVTEPEIAVDPTGRAVAVWGRSAGADTVVESASRPPGGRWSRPVELSAKGGRAMVARIAIDAAGEAVAVWQRFAGRDTVVQAASSRPGGGWSAPRNLSAKGHDALGPQVAVDPAGDAVAVWRQADGFETVVQSAGRPPGGKWSAPRDVSVRGEEAFVPQVAAGGKGEAVVVWESSDGDSRRVLGAWRSPAGAWSRPAALSGKGEGSAPAVAIDPAGEAVAVWEGKAGQSFIEGAARPTGGAFSAPVALSAQGRKALRPQVAIDAAGEAVAVWQRLAGKGFAIESAARPAGAAWSAATRLSAPGKYAVDARVGVADGGEAVAAWGVFAGSRLVAEGASRP